ncbi:hypothetical protein ACWEPR_06100 [Streptomyces sp. NPDC004290]
MFRTTRATAAFAALLGLVLGLLVCGASVNPASGAAPVVSGVSGGASVSPASGTAPVVWVVSGGASVSPASAAAPVVSGISGGTSVSPASGAAPVLLGAPVPGCDPGHSADEGAPGPVVPPRAHGFAELLPALAADRVPPGPRQPDPGGPAVRPGPEPPARVPPSPVELSVLRV